MSHDISSNLSSAKMLNIKKGNNLKKLFSLEQYHNLVSTTATEQIGRIATKTTRIKWKNGGDSGEKPSISLAHFLRMSKEGAW